jgi:hypothetical protein
MEVCRVWKIRFIRTFDDPGLIADVVRAANHFDMRIEARAPRFGAICYVRSGDHQKCGTALSLVHPHF